MLRIELETLALQWARPRATPSEIQHLRTLVDRLVEAGEQGDRQIFLERDFEVHRYCWRLSGNASLAETLERLMSPLFAFVVLASDRPLTSSMAREHYVLIDALASMTEPEFTAAVRKAFTGFATRWISAAPALSWQTSENGA